ncbi:MAG TPA: type II toxin-antitoxin system RelE/ParE family toxin [Tepidisphaeraceae bacterium]|nr:type II toxin-antitoxin system RelE/ParE family toxin [Tepidisphaeraceae bacterium]
MRSRRIAFTPEARCDLDRIADFIAARSPLNADRFLAKLEQEILALPDYGASVALAPEASEFSFKLRQIVVHPYRVLFRVNENVIEILHIRHGARTGAMPDWRGHPT